MYFLGCSSATKSTPKSCRQELAEAAEAPQGTVTFSCLHFRGCARVMPCEKGGLAALPPLFRRIEGCTDPGFCMAKGSHEQGFTWFSCGKSQLTALQDNTKQKQKLVWPWHPYEATGALPSSMPGRAGLCDSHPQGMHFAHLKAEAVFISHRIDLCQWKGRKSLPTPVLLLKLRPSKPDPSLQSKAVVAAGTHLGLGLVTRSKILSNGFHPLLPMLS